MSRMLDFVVLIVAIASILVVQTAGAAMLDPLRDELLEDGIDEKYNAEEQFADTFEMVTKWVPTTGLLGLVVLIAYREYRRQRVAAYRGP